MDKYWYVRIILGHKTHTLISCTHIAFIGKQLFTRIDSTAARQTAQEYAELYAKSASMLPGQATRDEYKERMAAHYPFHPTLIDFLNIKLTQRGSGHALWSEMISKIKRAEMRWQKKLSTIYKTF